MLEIPKEALFLDGKAFLNYRKSSGIKSSPLSNFYFADPNKTTEKPKI